MTVGTGDKAVTFNVNVNAKTAEKSLALKPGASATLDAVGDLELTGTYDISYQEYDDSNVVTLDEGGTITAGTTEGGYEQRYQQRHHSTGPLKQLA